MEVEVFAGAANTVEKFNVDLHPELLDASAKRRVLEIYCKLEKLVSYGKAVIASALDDAVEVAAMSGTSIAKAKAAVDAGKSLENADEVRDAF